MEASDSLSRTLGMDFFIPFPFPNFGNGFFSFPSRSRNLGMDLFIPFPFPNFGNGLFQFPSRSWISGMGFFNSLPVPEPSKVIPAHPWWFLPPVFVICRFLLFNTSPSLIKISLEWCRELMALLIKDQIRARAQFRLSMRNTNKFRYQT